MVENSGSELFPKPGIRTIRVLKLLTLSCIYICCICPGLPADELADDLAAGRFDRALRKIEVLLAEPAGGSREKRQRLLELRAKCLFELANYPACEETLLGLLETGTTTRLHKAELLAQVARLRSFQNDHSRAGETIERALELADNPNLRRVAIAIALRARKHEEALPHIKKVLEKLPRDPRAHYQLGLIQQRRGEYQLSIPALKRGLEVASLKNEASFELAMALRKSGRPSEALALLIDLLQEDPTIEHACYQAARCLLEIGGGGQARLAAYLLDYLKALKKSSGPSSRDHHLAAAGKAAEAWLLRATTREALGDDAGSLVNLRKAEGLSPSSPAVILQGAGFFLRRGLLEESRKRLARLGSAGEELKKSVNEHARALNELQSGPWKTALLQLAACGWAEAERRLVEALATSRQAAPEKSVSLARLLLARNPASQPALLFLTEHTGSPRLLIPHLHYLARLCATDPENTLRRKELAALRKLLLGS
ncbi:MAG: tetratricopeptide repeat protein [Planctomycetes bacterium]|nr:tetratricopeptide repeat protein [Planctomycetota bacterium]